MKKTKFNSAYTNKWLSRNRRFWHEEHVRGIPVIILDKEDAPKIVIKRVKKINLKRGWNNFDSTDEHIAAYFARRHKERNLLTCNEENSDSDKSIYAEEELRQIREEEDVFSDDEIDYDEYDEYYDDDR